MVNTSVGLTTLIALADGDRVSIVQESPHNAEAPSGYSVSFDYNGVRHSHSGATIAEAVNWAFVALTSRVPA
jgi:hypothetical protein